MTMLDERPAERVVDAQAERKEEGARAVVRAPGVVFVVEQRAEDDLRDFMAARGKLVEHQVLARHGAFVLVGGLLELVERARDEHVVGDLPPFESRVRRAGLPRLRG